jgi:hypothetical protein
MHGFLLPAVPQLGHQTSGTLISIEGLGLSVLKLELVFLGGLSP